MRLRSWVKFMPSVTGRIGSRGGRLIVSKRPRMGCAASSSMMLVLLCGSVALLHAAPFWSGSLRTAYPTAVRAVQGTQENTGRPAVADTVLIEVLLVEVSARVTVEALVQDTTVWLPSQAVRDLLGVQFPSAYVSLDQLRHEWPTLVARWEPETGRVLIWDEANVLPATRRFRESHQASAFSSLSIPAYSGTYGGFAVDQDKHAVADLGYLWRGRFQLAGRIDDRGAGLWNISASPIPRLSVNAMGGTGQPVNVSGRLSVGPAWLLTTYTEHQPLDVAGVVRLGAISTFVSKQYGVLTITPPGLVSLQVARQWSSRRTVARIGWGPLGVSQFSVPLTSVR